MAASANIRVIAQNFMNVKKLKIKNGQKISKGGITIIYITSNNEIQRLKSSDNGIVKEIFVSEGDCVQEGFVLYAVEGCSHPTVMKDMCADCGADLRVENSLAGDRKEQASASVAMVHSIPELVVSEQQAKEIGKADEDRLVKTRKLVLLVDLDQTLVHTTNDNIPPNLKDVEHFQLPHGNKMLWYHTRLRPGTKEFLERISKLYELHICTFGVRLYAHTIATILDPKLKLFSHRILSRDECFSPHAKTANLKALFPCGDSMVCIIDDREDVWHFSPNLVHVKPYRFFQGTADINAPPGLSKTEEDDKPMTHKVRRVSQSGMESTDSTSEEITKLEKESPKTDSKSELKSKPVNEIADTDNKTEESKPGNEKDQTGRKAEEKQKHVNELAENDSKMKDHSKQEAETAGIDSKMEGIKDDTNEGDSDDNKLLINEGNSDGDAKDRSDANQEISSKEKVKEEKSSDNSKQAKESDQQQQNKNETDVKQKTPETETKLNEDFIEWDDEDDYLFYLEEILKTIHSTFYDFYDQIKRNETEGIDVKDLDKPSLKNIIPYMRKKVLKGCNIVFSGVIPTNMNPEKSRAYVVAKALGATVQQDFLYKENEKDPTNYTTHLVAAKHGTTKVRTALKLKCIKIVNIDWLWCCTERWEKVEEILFPLAELDNGSGRDSPDPQKMKKELKRKVGKTEIGNSQSKKRQKVAPTGNGEGDENDLNAEIDTEQETPPTAMAETVDSSKPEAFSMSYNPILAFSDDDLAYMDKEVEDEMDDEFNESSEDENSRDVRIRTSVLKSEHLADLDVSESEESLSGDTPRGWGLKKLSPRSSSDEELKISNSPVREEVGPEYESETDQDKFEKIMDAFGPETEVSDNEEYQESVGSVDDEIAEAVIKEFLS